MDTILIVGAGGLGREVLGYLRHIEKTQSVNWHVKGFLDDNLAALDSLSYASTPVVGRIADYTPKAGEILVCAIALPAIKAKVFPALKAKGAQFMTLIHPSASIGCNVTLGEGVVIAPGCVINADVTIGDFVLFNCLCACGHDAKVGSLSTFSSYCDITGNVHIGERVFAGSHSSIIPLRHVGNDVNIGAGSVVISHLADGERVFGVPAKKIF